MKRDETQRGTFFSFKVFVSITRYLGKMKSDHNLGQNTKKSY